MQAFRHYRVRQGGNLVIKGQEKEVFEGDCVFRHLFNEEFIHVAKFEEGAIWLRDGFFTVDGEQAFSFYCGGLNIVSS